MTGPPLRVIHLAAAREWRGGQRQVLLLAEALAGQVEQVVVTASGSRLESELRAAGVPAHPVDWNRGLAWPPLRAAVRAARLTASLLHAHDSHGLILAGLAARFAPGTPVVATRRTDYPLRRPGFWRRAARVIAISRAVRDALVASGIAPERIELIPDGIDVGATRAVTAGSVRTTLGLPEDRPLAVHVGALTPDKDQATLLRAAAILHRSRPDLHWAIAGAGPLAEPLAALARDLGIDPVIHFVGQLADPRTLIAAGSLFVISSAHEGLGSSALDAMALGRPIVATRAGGLPEVLGDGAGLLVPVADPGALANGVDAVLASPDLARRLVEAAARQVTGWSAAGMASSVVRVYRSVALDR